MVVGAVKADGLVVPDADQAVAPAHKTGGGFEFRAEAVVGGQPVLRHCHLRLAGFPRAGFVDKDRRRPFGDRDRRLHAQIGCCHHTLGHTRLTQQRFGGVGVQPFYYLRPLLKNMELDADGCAVRVLTLTRESGAIERARTRMLEFSDRQTGAYYPTGIERADNIARGADEE
jgi:hypothetical protein